MWRFKLDPFLGDLRQLEQRYHLEPTTVLQGNTGKVIDLRSSESAPGSIACMGKTTFRLDEPDTGEKNKGHSIVMQVFYNILLRS